MEWIIDMKIKERPILFNGEMVRAILDGRKTQTRRVVKAPKSLIQDTIQQKPPYWKLPIAVCEKTGCFADVNSPYGKAGDQLWVRETFAIESNFNMTDVYLDPDNPLGPVRDVDDGAHGHYFECPRYRASEPDTILGDDGIMRWKPSIFMPRWASRIQLKVTDVRVESVQDIVKNCQDILEEGIIYDADAKIIGPCEGDAGDLIEQFSDLWDSINKKRGYSWDSNPWVWVVEFERINDSK